MRLGRRAVSVLLVIALVLMGMISGGCDLLRYTREYMELKKEFEENPCVYTEMQLKPRETHLLVGDVTFNKDYKGPVLFVVASDKFKKREVAAKKILFAPVKIYDIFLLEGSYDLYFFADVDGNGLFETSETIGRTLGNSVSVTKPASNDKVTVNGPTVQLNLENPFKSDLSEPILGSVIKKLYVRSSLDDEFFDDKYAQFGLTNLAKFEAKIPSNLFALEKFDPAKTVVLFVHGVKGTPRVFKDLVKELDRNKFQAWFYYYPSQLPLAHLGTFLADVLKNYEGDISQRPRVIVVAHSMGGLVALSGLNELCADSTPDYLKGYISFVSPYGGVESASWGRWATAPIPMWEDIAVDSDFLKRLAQGKATTRIPFYLFFGYKTGKSSDGDIILQSQLYHDIHFNALKSYGFNTSHEGILRKEKNNESIEKFLKVLDDLDKR